MLKESIIKILYIDKEENNLSAFRAYFRRKQDFVITTSATFEETLINELDFHVIVIDQGTLKMGVDLFCPKLKELGAKVAKIVVTAYRDITEFESYLASGDLFDCLYKPVDFDLLGRAIEKAYLGISNKKQDNPK